MADQQQDRLARLADPARTHGQLAGDAREARDKAIYDEWQAGASIKDLAERTGLSRSRVHQITVEQAANNGAME